MPITLTLEDYNATEKIGYPPRKLSTASAPDGVDPSVGDKDFSYSRGVIGLGRIDSGIEDMTRVPSEEKV